MAKMAWREANQARWVGVRPAHNGTIFSAYNAVANATAIVFTVPAGNTAYLFYLDAHAVHTNAEDSCTIWIRDTADVLWAYLATTYQSAAGSFHWAVSFPFPIEIPAGYDICITSNAPSANIRCVLWGWLE